MNDFTSGECASKKTLKQLLIEVRDAAKCPTNYDPTCARDGDVYDNECLANLLGKGAIPCPELAGGKRQAPKPCNMDNNPVCGSDGTTYPNACAAENA